ncbi:non-ribosomal peptide synthetase [Vibrio mangrovi]|uniref:Amino acid adenylation domain-containing protein n=1 Tax=Vibrio mangrovi TaxID=474394 RepID=A0A1Y6J2X3_9VIBR|nr:non-ribosomal peptide synthetase [Vibrio mangrovi]MDW6002056.1 amino acid adenylation domain-containing protein [Vibrio mangrovi]SMS03062.1 Tyrocidine synthase 3 [Vibrio mangrovi]
MTDTRFSIDELSPEEMMAILEQLEQDGALQPQIPGQEMIVAADESRREFPLSLAQQRLWVLSQMDAATTAAYIIAAGLRIQGPLNMSALTQALDHLVVRHSALRTHIEIRSGKPMQIISPPDCGFPLEINDSVSDEADIAYEEPRFDLTRGRLVQGRLIRQTETDHTLYIAMHHIIADGWSMGILTEELSTLYRAFAQGMKDPLPLPAIQFGDYALWQQEHVQGDMLERQQQYWISHLQGAPEFLALPTDRPRPELRDYIGSNVMVTLDADLTAGLRALSQRHGCTLYMTLLASWATLMSRLAGQEEVVIGTPVAGRTRKEVGHLIGMFVNTQALRIDFSQPLNTEALLAQVKATSLAAQSNQDIPFEQVVEAVAPQRSLSYSPVFQVLFTLQNQPKVEAELADMRLSHVEVPDTSAKVDLALIMTECDDHLSGTLNYATALFEPATIERYFSYWKCLLEGMVAENHPCVQTLPILPEAERTYLIQELNRTAMDFAEDVCIHQLFEEFVWETPDATALVTDCESLTYGELNTRANQLAHWLVEQGVRPDSRVAVSLPRSADLLIAMLAAMKAGGVYVPMDPNYPDGRLIHMLTDSAPQVLITHADVRPRLGDIPQGCTEVDINTQRHLWAGYATTNLDAQALNLTSRHLAYIIYTSGSTGKPKGVMIEHHGLCNVSFAQRKMLGVGKDSRVLQFGSISFDASLFEMVLGICSGAELHFAGPGQPLGEELLTILKSRRITHAPLPPAALASMRTDVLLPDLKMLLTAGEAVTRTVIEPWLTEGRMVYNGYGPTETTIWGTTCALHQGFEGQPPIGLPRPNGKIYILDSAGEPVPVGVTGEIYIGGVGIARGYLNRPELTGERFVPDPFSAQPDARMYRTGDLGCWKQDGLIHYQGRCDNQVKIRGYRIELGEIETALRRCVGIQDAVVTAQKDKRGNQRLVGYYTQTAATTVSLADLKSRLNETLPDYMIPSAYMLLTQLPLTPNGKVDHKALPPADETAFAHREYEAPQSDIEQLLATIWSDLLGISQVGRQDHFFELGGHSLLSVQLIEQLRQRGYHLSVKSLFNHPTLASLALALSEDRSVVETAVPQNLIPEQCTEILPEMLPLTDLTSAEIDVIAASVTGGTANIQDIYPLAPLQEGILYHHILQKDSDPYITPVILTFEQKSRMTHFLTALQAVIQRHDILRTGIVWDGLREAQQVVWRDAPLSVHELQIHELSQDELAPATGGPEQDIVRILQEHFAPSRVPMDVSQAPMLAVHFMEDPANDRWVMCLLQHHLCMDHTTLELVIEEVQAHLLGQEQSLPHPIPFRNFVAQARAELDKQTYVDYFREQLADIETTSAPFDLLETQSRGHQIESLRHPVDDGLAQQIRTQARLYGVSAASLFHLAWGMVIRATTGRDDVVFGTVLFGRMAGGDGADRALGMFLNTLPLRLSLGDIATGEAVRTTHRLLAELLNYEHAPLSQVQKCSGVSAPAPLFTSLLNYRYQGGSSQTKVDAEQSEFAWQGIDMLMNEERTNYPVGLSVDDLEGVGFSLDLKVDHRIGAELIAVMVENALTALMTALEADSDRPVHQLNILPDSERERVLETFNQTKVPFPEDDCIHSLIEGQVARNPDATAVIFEEQLLSYAELNRQANQLARWLVELGVRPDSRVAVCLERSCELVVSLLAILKAGGAYVPLDPGYPTERLEYMLSDSEPVVLITTGTLLESLGQTPAATRLVDLSSLVQPWTDCPDTNPNIPELTNRHLAYIIYTSGSTGLPKGVMNEHRGVVNRLYWMKEDYGFGPGDVVLQKTPFSFDVSVWEFFCPLWSGATLLMAKPEGHKDPDYLKDLITSQGVTILHFVPPMLQSFLEVVHAGDCRSLRLVFCSGEALPAEAIRKSYARLPHIELHNLYGPTEAAVDVTAWHCLRTLAGDRVSIGRPVANTRMYVLDGEGRPVAVGVEGELYIGGVQVARGYLHRDELTAERFVADPYSQETDAVMYRTGDVGCWLSDGTIEYRGRNDDQVKIRGFRIELGEISSALQGCVGVKDGVVVARALGSGPDKQLVGYYTAEDQAACSDVESIKAELSGRLPVHMVPVAYVLLDEMPLTPNGKVNRKALPEPDEHSVVRREYEAPVGDAEMQLADIWSSLLGVERVGRYDNFFELGGHSLLAVRMVSEAQKQGVSLDLATLMSTPVLHELAVVAVQSKNTIDQVIPFRNTGQQLPLFIVPEFSGELLYGPALTAAIDPDVPVYGLSAPNRMQPSLKTYQRMAERYVNMIRQTQPEGPYRLFGWSSGGVLAYEIAAQLLGQDQNVEFLGMLDSWVPGVVEQPEQSDDEMINTLSHNMVAYLAEQMSGQSVDLPEQGHWRDYYQAACTFGCLPQSWTENYFHQMLIHQKDFLRAEYHPLPLPVHIDIIAAEKSPQITPLLGWDRVLPEENIHCVTVPGTHYELVSAPYVEKVGDSISQAIVRRREFLRQNPPLQSHNETPVMKLQNGEAGQPVVLCIPGAGDNVFSFVDFVHAMPSDWTVLAIQPRGLWGGGIPHSSVEAAAAFYLRALEDVLDTRDIHVVGHSFGGWVAVSLVTQMEAQGISVKSLTIADSRVPMLAHHQEYSDVQALIRLIELFEMRGCSLGMTEKELTPLSYDERLALTLSRLIENGLLPKNTRISDFAGIFRVFATNIRIWFTPDVLPETPMTLVMAQGSSPERFVGWKTLMPEMKVLQSLGNHMTLLKLPNVQLLADTVQGKSAI